MEPFAALAGPYTAEALFDAMPDLAYFVKNARGEYVVVNRALAERVGAATKADVIGKTCAELFPSPLGAAFLAQDLEVVRTGAAIVERLELHPYPAGGEGWCLTSKYPLLGAGGRPVGLYGMSRDVHSGGQAGEFAPVAEAVRIARADPGQFGPAELAAAVGLSAYQLDQRMQRLFRVTTGQFLLKLRMELAARLLRDTAEPLVRVAASCGYADQSAFGRQFRAATGRTPGEFRRARS